MKYSANDNLEVMKYAKNYNNFLVKNVINTIKCNNCKNILDFGCADGYFIEKIVKAINNIAIAGVEIDEESFSICKNKNICIYKSINEIKNRFDLIYSFNVLEHIKNDSEALEELYNKLNDNGKIVIYVPALMFLYSSMDKKTGHYRRYSKSELISKLQKIGFKIEKVEYCDSLGILATLLYILKDKILKNSNGNINKTCIVLYDYIFLLSRLFDNLIFKYFCGKNLFVSASK